MTCEFEGLNWKDKDLMKWIEDKDLDLVRTESSWSDDKFKR